MLSGNKGEWSEIYVFLKLLSDGKLYAADENLNRNPNVFFPILRVIRYESDGRRDYVINGNIEVIDGKTNESLMQISKADFLENAKFLLSEIKRLKGKTFEIPTIEAFLHKIKVKKISSKSSKKSDIQIVVHDSRIGIEIDSSFSIKSLVGGNSTLFNPGNKTNFIFKVIPPENVEIDVDNFNRQTLEHSKTVKSGKMAIRIENLEKIGCQFIFDSIQSTTLYSNLLLIDGNLPEIIAWMLFLKFKTGKSKTAELLNIIKKDNPLGFNLSGKQPFYEYKVKNFLTDNALGMTPEEDWTGYYDTTGGIIFVKEDGDIICYHIYNRNDFQDYLLNNTKLEQPSTGEDELNPGYARTDKTSKKYHYGWLYCSNETLYMKFNLQVRFID